MFLPRLRRHSRLRGGLEVGDGRQFVPLDRLLAEVKVFESECDAAQKVVLTQRLGTEHAQLKLPQAQGFLAVATVHQLWRKRREKESRTSCFMFTLRKSKSGSFSSGKYEIFE